MNAEAQALDLLLSKDAIRQLLAGYSRGVDRGDKELLASVYWEDSTMVSGGMTTSGPEFAATIVDFITADLDHCYHALSNEWIEVNGEHAIGEHYVIAYMTAGGQDITTGGRYLDSYERRGGIWKIKTRTFVADWTTSYPKSLELDAMYEPGRTRGGFGTGDPVYAHWARL